MKKIKIWALYFSLLSISSYSSEFEKFPWLVKVSSSYQDLANPKVQQSFTGHGFVIKYLGKYFVVTASHLSQGGVEQENPTFRLESFDVAQNSFVPIPFIKRLAHNRRDIEIIEIKAFDHQKPLAEYIAPSSLPVSERNYFPRGKLSLTQEWQQLFQQTSTVTVQANGLVTAKGEKIAPEGFVPLGLLSFVPKTSLGKTFLSPFQNITPSELADRISNTKSFYFRQSLLSGLDSTDGELIAALPSYPGMSGLPLILRIGDSIHIGGLVTSSSRNFNSSWFAQDQHILFVLQKLNTIPNDARPEPSQSFFSIGNIFWRNQQGLLFRKGSFPIETLERFQVEFSEAVFGRSRNGNGTRADGGNRTRADGGGGAHPQLPKDLMPQGILFGLGNQPPQSTVAFKISIGGKWNLVTADMSSVNWILEEFYGGRMSRAHLKPILAEDKLPHIFYERFLELGYRPNADHIFQIPLNSELMTPLNKHTQSKALAILSFKKNSKQEFEHLELSIEVDGHIFSTSHSSKQEFIPEITLEDKKTKQKFKVDLSGLLMTSTSSFNFEWERSGLSSHYNFPNPPIRFRIRSDEGTEYLLYSEK